MLGKNIAIDIGTNSIKAFVQGRGVIFSQACAVSYDNSTGKIIAIGNSAAEMLEKSPDTIEVKYPISGGVISDYSAMNTILSHIIKKFSAGTLFKPNLIICVPGSCADIQKKTIIDISCLSGAGRVCIIENPVASAYGCALDLERPFGNLVVDIGAGTTDIAVISMGSVAVSSTIRLGGNDLDEAIIHFIRFGKKVHISKKTAQRLKKEIGCADKPTEEIEMSFFGKDAVTSQPKLCHVTNKELLVAVSPILKQIADEIRVSIEQIPPEMFNDICLSGMCLTGGTSKLKGIDSHFSKLFSIPVRINPDAENSAVKGGGYVLKNIGMFEDLGYVYKVKHQKRFINNIMINNRLHR